jgi:hypothetical protein
MGNISIENIPPFIIPLGESESSADYDSDSGDVVMEVE